MPISKEDSIVADSTISSSPPPSTPPPKRPQARRTYGRPKPVVEEPTSATSFSAGMVSGNTISSTGRKYALYDDLPTSEMAGSSPDRTLLNDESFDDDRITKDASGVVDWSWKADMKKIDEGEDNGFPGKPVKASRTRVEDPESPVSLSESQRETTSLDISTHPPTSPSDPSSAAGLRGTLSTLTIHSSPTKSISPEPVSPRVTHTTSRALDSESEREIEHTSSQSLAKSSINSPKTRLSTPPTSDEDMPQATSTKPTRPKASRKSSDRLPLDLQPQSFEDSTKKPPKAAKKSVSKVKPPTKKELRETNAERQRMAAAKNISLKEHVTSSSTKEFSMRNLFHNLQASKSTQEIPESDPIEQFTSSPDVHLDHRQPEASTSRAQLKSPSRSKVSPRTLNADSDSDDLPETVSMSLSKSARTNLTGKQLELAETKKKLLQRQSAIKDDSEDDLEIVDERPNPSASKGLAGVKKESRNTQQKLVVAHRKPLVPSSGLAKKSLPGASLSTVTSNPAKFHKIMIEAALSEAAEIRRRKEEEWTRRGGKLASEPDDQQQSNNVGIAVWAERGLLAASKVSTREQENDGVDYEDGEDEDYIPAERGSASPRGSGDEGEEEDITMVNEDDEGMHIVNRRLNTRGRAVVDSDEDNDDENDENGPSPHQVRRNMLEDFSMAVDEDGPSESVTRRRSLSSYATEDEGDKENIDRGEDKENQAVAVPLFSLGGSTRPPLGSRQGSLLGLQESTSRLSMSPGDRALEEEEEENQPVRRPLKPLRSEESFSPSVPFSARLERAASFARTEDLSSPTLDRSPEFAPLVTGGGSKLEFSQFSQDDVSFSPKPLQAGFSDLFESGTQKEPLEKNDTELGGLRKTESLELTQDVALQPALEVAGTLQRRADAIFEKEQEYLLQAANENQAALRKEPTLYVNDLGFLTQTRPDSSNPEIYRPAPTPTQTQSSERFPFRELPVPAGHHFVDDIDDSPEPSLQQKRLRRLRKGSPSRSSLSLGGRLGADSSDELSPPPSPSRRPAKVNAFDMLGKKNKDLQKQKSKRGPLDKNEFVEDQALESDEDETFGFVRNKDEEEEDGEHLDKTLVGLVDDKVMSEDAIAADRVMERYQEDVEKDDAELEKLHMRAIQGEIRKNKRNRGVGVDDSDDEDEEDAENRRRRRKMNDRIDRTDIEALRSRPETTAFAETYLRGLKDDDQGEYEHLNQLSANPLGDILMGRPKEEEANAGEGDDEDGGEDEEDDEEDQFITPQEIARQAREVARIDPGGELENDFDPNDVSFIDRVDEDDEEIQVKTVSRPTKANKLLVGARPFLSARPDMEVDFDQPRRTTSFMHDETGQKRMNDWASAEGRKLKTTAGFGRGTVAVTGHGRKEPVGSGRRTGFGSGSRKTGGSASGGQQQQRTSSSKPLKAAGSMLKSVDQKRGDLFAP